MPCCADTRCIPQPKPNARQVVGQRLWLAGTHSFASRHLHSPSGLQDKSCTASKPPCGRSLAEAAAATIWFSVTRKIPFALVKRKGHSHHTAANLRHVSLLLRSCNHAQAHYLPFRAEKCSSLRSSRVDNVPPTAPDVGGVQDWLGMAALSLPFRTSAHGSPCSRVSRRQAASTPDICLRQTHASGFSVANIAHCASIGHRKCLRLRLLPRY